MRTPDQYFQWVVLAGLVVASVAGGAQGWPGTLVITETNNGTTVNAFVGQPIRVNLHGNPSTGFEWLLTNTIGDSVLTNGAMTYVQDPGGMPGLGGMFGFPFLAVKPGDTALAFEYRQQWQGGGPGVQSFAVTIHVNPAPPQLSIRLAKPNIYISWPIAGSSGFYLEGTANLDPAQWAAPNVLVWPEGTNYVVTLGIGGEALFFRLRQ